MPTTGSYKKEEADVPTETIQGYKAILSLIRLDGGSVLTGSKNDVEDEKHSINL